MTRLLRALRSYCYYRDLPAACGVAEVVHGLIKKWIQ
jgi:hypothetical protein